MTFMTANAGIFLVFSLASSTLNRVENWGAKNRLHE